MRLTRFTDYALRVMLYLGTQPERFCAISEIAQAYGISQNHLVKVVHDLGKAGYLTSARGRFGGVKLARPATDINVGAVIRHTEEGFDLVDCTDCAIAPVCGLTRCLKEAMAAFLAVLDRHSLADLLDRRGEMARLLQARCDQAEPV
jgi:Rrf2 family nitric oxide-sensitive transcriptional repressor